MENIKNIWEDIDRLREKLKIQGFINGLQSLLGISLILVYNDKFIGGYVLYGLLLLSLFPMWNSYRKWQKIRKTQSLQ